MIQKWYCLQLSNHNLKNPPWLLQKSLELDQERLSISHLDAIVYDPRPHLDGDLHAASQVWICVNRRISRAHDFDSDVHALH